MFYSNSSTLETELELVGRSREILADDFKQHKNYLFNQINGAKVLVIGGAGSIGSAIVQEIFSQKPKTLDIIDIDENSLVELVRFLRIKFNFSPEIFRIFTLDIGSAEFQFFLKSQKYYDYVLNLSALKHVRSEGDPFTLMRMIKVNIVNNINLIETLDQMSVKKFFCVSSDKAVDPYNVMGATKRLMELVISCPTEKLVTSSARFANVAFSKGSLLYSFCRRFENFQPFIGPSDTQRYFISHREAGLLCLFSLVLGKNAEIFFPKIGNEIRLQSFPEIAERFLFQKGFKAHFCENSDEFLRFSKEKIQSDLIWPCYFKPSQTTGEKKEEVFFSEFETIDMSNFSEIGIVKNNQTFEIKKIHAFSAEISSFIDKGCWNKADLINSITKVIPNFNHFELNKNLSDAL